MKSNGDRILAKLYTGLRDTTIHRSRREQNKEIHHLERTRRKTSLYGSGPIGVMNTV